MVKYFDSIQFQCILITFVFAFNAFGNLLQNFSHVWTGLKFQKIGLGNNKSWKIQYCSFLFSDLMLCHCNVCLYVERCFAQWRYTFSFNILSVVMLSADMQSVIMLIVLAPIKKCPKIIHSEGGLITKEIAMQLWLSLFS